MRTLEKIVGGALLSGIVACKQDYGIFQQPEYCLWTDSFDQPVPSDGVDILWVIDASGSMSNDRDRLMVGIEAMMNALPPSGWRLNMISTDPTVVLYDQQFPLVPGDTIDDAKQMYAFMQKGVWEQGFEAVMMYMESNTYASTWMRNTAGLLVVFVSDEEDQSFFGYNDADAITKFEDWFTTVRTYKALASIVNVPPEESLCDPYEYDVGDRYIEATRDFGGVVVDICTEDWSYGVRDASQELIPIDEWQLTYTPDEESVVVFVDETPYAGWEYDSLENKVLFVDVPPEGTHVDITYQITNEKECPSRLDTGI
jgi:hypothetical protein